MQLGDRVRRGQLLAKIEDREIVEQVKQAEASHEVSQATIRQREADLKLAETNLDRSKNLFERQLLAKQTLDDAEARYQAAAAQLDLAQGAAARRPRRGSTSCRSTWQNTIITSPVDGFVGKRTSIPGALVSQNTPIVSVVDISHGAAGRQRRREGPAAGQRRRRRPTSKSTPIPGEKFNGRIARVAPVLDPATRTAQMEIEIPNADFRLKPGMYARVSLTVEERKDALVVPKNAVVDFESKRGVCMPNDEQPRDVRAGEARHRGRRRRSRSRRGLNEGDTHRHHRRRRACATTTSCSSPAQDGAGGGRAARRPGGAGGPRRPAAGGGRGRAAARRRAAAAGASGGQRTGSGRQQPVQRLPSSAVQTADSSRSTIRSSRPLMSIPRLAIQRPVTMFMISVVIILLGGSR